MRALVVEDDDLKGRALGRRLAAAGYTVDWCRTYSAACDALSVSADSVRYDLASLDFRLGPDDEHTGLDVAEYIASMPMLARPRKIEVHSSDDAGSVKMLDRLAAAGTWATRSALFP